MPEKEKKPGLQKDLSSIFAGLEEVDNGRAGKETAPESPKPPEEIEPEEKPAPAPLRIVSDEVIVEGTFPHRRNACVGLDIGQSSIKMVQVYPASGGWEIGGIALKEFRLEFDEEGLEDKESLLGELKQLLAGTRSKNCVFTCSLEGDNVNTSLIPLARMPNKELESACRLEAKRRASFDVGKAVIQSHLVAGETARPGAKLNYLVTVVRREALTRRLDILQSARLQVSGLLPLPFAWKELPGGLSKEEAEAARAVIDIGSDRTLVSIYRGRDVQFSREFQTGADDVTEAIIQAGRSLGKETEISWEKAETLKATKNLFQAGAGGPVIGDLSAPQLMSMVRPVLERIVQESKRSLDYYGQLFPGAKMGRIWLAGGGVLMEGLVKFFQERISLPVEILQLPSGIGFHPSIRGNEDVKKLFPRLAAATALALNRKPETNFLPPLDLFLQKLLRSKVAIAVLIVFLFGISFYFYRVKAAEIPGLKTQVESSRSRLAEMERKLGAYAEAEALQRQILAKQNLGKYSSLRQPNWEHVLKELSRITPPGIILREIELDKDSLPLGVICQGRVRKGTGALDSEVSNFLVAVGDSPFFKNVKELYLDIDEKDRTASFSFSCTLVY